MTITLFNRSRDAYELIRLYQGCFAEAPWFERFTEGSLLTMFTQIDEWPEALILVVHDKGRLVACGIGFDVSRKPDVLEQLPVQERDSFYVAELFVAANMRCRGLCSTLADALIRSARHRGYTRVSVRTSVEQPAIQHVFVNQLGCNVVGYQDVVSTKWINGCEQEVPDRRILMSGSIDEALRISRVSIEQILSTYA